MMVPGWKLSVCVRIVWPERPSRICNNKSSIYDNSKLKGTTSQHSLVTNNFFWYLSQVKTYLRNKIIFFLLARKRLLLLTGNLGDCLPERRWWEGGEWGLLEVVHIGHAFIRKTVCYRRKFCNFRKWTIPLVKNITLRHG